MASYNYLQASPTFVRSFVKSFEMRPDHPASCFQSALLARLGILALLTFTWLVGCGGANNTIVEETDSYGYDDVLAQIDAEESPTGE